MTDWKEEVDPHWRERLQERWERADKMGATKVQEIPLPWRHRRIGIVVAIEYPPDRPAVVDLVFEDGLRMAETKDSRYIRHANGWGYPDE
jgi:hypothetical protein